MTAEEEREFTIGQALKMAVEHHNQGRLNKKYLN
jgi:hypothetical protein